MNNTRLPPTTRTFWSYGQDSFSWRPIEYNNYQRESNNWGQCYLDYVRDQIKHPNALILMHGGLSPGNIDELILDTLKYPDIRSNYPGMNE